MNINWLGSTDNKSAVTIYENNIVLNKQASDFFVNSYMVAIGVDQESKSLVIKSVTKEESISYKNPLYKIGFTKSYGRINAKSIVDCIKDIYNLDFSKSISYKYNAKYNNLEKMLVVDCGGAKND